MNIVYGGSFNPPTIAHLEIVNKLLIEFPNSNVIVLPVGNSYDKKELIPFNYRYEMLKLMFNNNSKVIVSNLEDTNEFKGTLKSLDILSNTYNNIGLTIGSDNIYNLNKWINYEILIKKYPLIIFKRNNDDIIQLLNEYKYLDPKYYIVEFNNSISSSLIRSNINKYRESLDSNVYKYIIENKLYEV